MKTKGIFAKTFKFVSASIGELVVGGLILGATYCKGYFDAVNEKKKNPEEDKDQKETKEAVAEEAAESEKEVDAPPIEVSVNNQPED